MSGSTRPEKPKSAAALRTAATRLRAEALALGKVAHAHAKDQAKLDDQARAMIARLDAIIAEGGREDAEVPSILGDAMLDLMFVLEGGTGPASLQLGSQIS